MPDNGMILTTQGHKLLVRALSGTELRFTKAQIGDGYIGSYNPYELDTLINPRKDFNIQAVNLPGTGTCEVVLELTNKGVTQGFFVREYGLFAQNPDGGDDILYAYCNKGDECSYLEADNGLNPINYTLSIVTVIDQAQNVTANIESTANYVTVNRLESRIADIYAPQEANPHGLWAYSPESDNRLRKISIPDARTLMIGTHDTASILDRISRLEDAMSQVLLSVEMQELFPEYTHYIIEDFNNVNQVDMFNATITSIVAGDDSIDCEPIEGMIPGSWYTITDGVNTENVQVKSVSIENGIQRVILSEPIKNTYILEFARILRTSANIANQKVTGPLQRKTLSWIPGFKWQGQGENTSYTVNLSPNSANLRDFEISGNVIINSAGYFTMAR